MLGFAAACDDTYSFHPLLQYNREDHCLTDHPKSGHKLATLLPKLQRITGAGASDYTREVPLDPSNITENQLLKALDPAAGGAHSRDVVRMAWSEQYKALLAELPMGEQSERLVPAGMIDQYLGAYTSDGDMLRKAKASAFVKGENYRAIKEYAQLPSPLN